MKRLRVKLVGHDDPTEVEVTTSDEAALAIEELADSLHNESWYGRTPTMVVTDITEDARP